MGAAPGTQTTAVIMTHYLNGFTKRAGFAAFPRHRNQSAPTLGPADLAATKGMGIWSRIERQSPTLSMYPQNAENAFDYP